MLDGEEVLAQSGSRRCLTAFQWNLTLVCTDRRQEGWKGGGLTEATGLERSLETRETARRSGRSQRKVYHWF